MLRSGPLSVYAESVDSLCVTKLIHNFYCIAECLLYNVTEAKVRLGGFDLCCAAGLAVFVAAEALL